MFLQGEVVIRPETCVAIRPESCVAIRPITRKKNCAGMTAIRPITRKFFARKFFTRKFLDLWVYLKKKIFRFFFRVQNTISAKGHFCGFDFYKTNHSKIRIVVLWILAENSSFRSNLPISAKSHFCRFNFYKTNHSEISRRERLF